MARVVNYGDLKAAVAARLHRTDLDDRMDEAVQVVEQQVMIRMVSWMLSGSIYFAEIDRAVPGSPSYFLPFDFWQVEDIYTVDPNSFEIEGDSSAMDTQGRRALLNQTRQGVTKIPPDGYFISADASYITFNRAPPDGEIILMYYIESVPQLLADSDFTFLLRFAPQVYIFGMCKELAVSIQDMELAQAYNDMFEAAIKLVNDQHKRLRNEGPIQIEGASQFC